MPRISKNIQDQLIKEATRGNVEAIESLLTDNSITPIESNNFSTFAKVLETTRIHCPVAYMPLYELLLRSTYKAHQIEHLQPIHLAAVYGSVPLVDLEIKEGAAPYLPIQDGPFKGQTVLLIAATFGHLSLVEYLCNHNPDLAQKEMDAEIETLCDADLDNPHNYILPNVIRRGDMEVFRYLYPLMVGKLHDKLCAEILKILFIEAIISKKIQIVIFLMDHLIEVDVGNDFFYTAGEKYNPFHLAAGMGDIEIMAFLYEHLVEAGVDFNASGQDLRKHALCLSISSCHFETTMYLMQKMQRTGIFINTLQFNGYGTPLHIAAKSGDVTITDELCKINSGENINEPVKNGKFQGQTPLYIAASQGHIEVVKILCGYLSPINNMRHFASSGHIATGYTARMFQVLRNRFHQKSYDFINTPLTSGKQKGATPLLAAVAHEHVEIVFLFLEHARLPDQLVKYLFEKYVKEPEKWGNVMMRALEKGVNPNLKLKHNGRKIAFYTHICAYLQSSGRLRTPEGRLILSHLMNENTRRLQGFTQRHRTWILSLLYEEHRLSEGSLITFNGLGINLAQELCELLTDINELNRFLSSKDQLIDIYHRDLSELVMATRTVKEYVNPDVMLVEIKYLNDKGEETLINLLGDMRDLAEDMSAQARAHGARHELLDHYQAAEWHYDIEETQLTEQSQYQR